MDHILHRHDDSIQHRNIVTLMATIIYVMDNQREKVVNEIYIQLLLYTRFNWTVDHEANEKEI